jgi:predicted metal-binding membrane protein
VLEAVVRRDRALTAAGLVALAGMAWIWVVRMAVPAGAGAASVTMPGMPAMPGMQTGATVGMPALPGMESGGTPGVPWLAGMWAVMMVAMMLPSATPTILLFGNVTRRRQLEGRPAVPVAVFTLGYLAVWVFYAIVAAVAQWKLHRLALLSPSMAAASPVLAGGLLIAAGVYQLVPLKRACLSHCRSPLHFFSTEWREGVGGALAMGMRHGTYCVGCCWLLMALLFVAGVMNLVWVAVIAGFVLVEKLVPRGAWFGRLGGVALVVWGAWVLTERLL